MRPQPIKHLLRSIFPQLLLITGLAGLAITITVIVGAFIIHAQSEDAMDRNLLLYTEYLVADLGQPPDQQRAKEIARITGAVIRFSHDNGGWQTGPMPSSFDPKHARIHQLAPDMVIGKFRGHHFIRRQHGGGELYFVAVRDTDLVHKALWTLMGMAVILIAVLALAHGAIRRTLRPLHSLKEGVEQVGAGRLDHRIPAFGPREFRDLSDTFNAMAGRLEQLIHSKEQLLLDVSHELRSPITRLKVQLEFLKDREDREALAADVAEMEAMVTTLLESARLRSPAALKRQPVGMAGLVRAVVAGFESRLPAIVTGMLPEVTLSVDEEKIRTVLRNLLDNALKHTPDNGAPVQLDLKVGPEHVEIVVADQGEGIPAGERPHLFEPFYRPDLSRSRKTGGYGLGLSLCKAIVEAHGGDITLASTLGQGTRVTVRLPAGLTSPPASP